MALPGDCCYIAFGMSSNAVAEAAASEQSGTIRNVWGELVEKPRYGGTITISTQVDYQHTDPWYNWNGTISASPVLEKLGIGDWSIHRDQYPFNSGFVPIDVIKPHLAERWEMPDPTTIIFHIRRGIHWQDKPPVNGRELDAYDVEISLQRAMGYGKFSSLGASPYAHMVKSAMLASVEARDQWTVVVKVKQPSLLSLSALYWQSWEGAWISPREVIEQYGDHRNWRHLVGTGPFMLADHVDGASWTYVRNPGYWYRDERFPGMKLPFADSLKLLVIPDRASQIAALRSGKIDVLTALTIEEARAISKSNPEIIIHYAQGGGTENFGQWADPKYDGLAEAAYAATDMATFTTAVKKASTYYASQHITLANAYPDAIVAVQPWIKGGYWGQIATGGGGMVMTIWSRFWVDQSMKE